MADVQSARVPTLDYAPIHRPTWHWRPLLTYALAAYAATGAALFALVITPARFQATGYVQVAPPNRYQHYSEDDYRQMRPEQAAVVNVLSSGPFHENLAAALREGGFASRAADQLARSLRSESICESRLIKVTAEGRNARDARRAADIAVESSRAVNAGLPVEVIRRPDLPLHGRRNKLPALLTAALAAPLSMLLFRGFSRGSVGDP